MMMDKTFVKKVVDGLKSTSASKVLETLFTIKKEVISKEEGVKLFRQCEGLQFLVPLLRKPNERILDLTLSILGNCCLDEESNETVGILHVVAPLITILKIVHRDSIIGRACRVIGNLAQQYSNAEQLHNHGAVAELMALIENRDKNTSYPTLAMAVRALRQLWVVHQRREEMLGLNSVRSVALLLITECETAGIIKSNNSFEEGLRKSLEELIVAILKCLTYFATYCTEQCADQINGDGRGYHCLVTLTKSFELLALKCLMNLCFVSQCRPLLGTAGLVECFVGVLQKYPDVTKWPNGATLTLAQLSGESVNRSRLRHCKGLPLLVAAARVSRHALQALLQYVFDDSCFQILINEGLIKFLTEELIQYIKTMDFKHDNIVTKPVILTKIVDTRKVDKRSSGDSIESLFTRRKNQTSCSKDDDLKVVIERDNMIVGFVDAVDSDATDESQNEDDNPSRRKCLKRTRSGSPKLVKRQTQLIKMASKDWSAGVYWEPKSPEWPSTSQASGSRAAIVTSPTRIENSPSSPYSEGYQSGFSPDYRGSLFNKRARWDWSPESGIGTNEGSTSSPHWTESQWSPCSSGPVSPVSVNQDSSDSEVSGRYSPVCSDAEAEAEAEGEREGGAGPPASDADAAQVAHDLDELLVMDDDDDPQDVQVTGNPKTIVSNSKSARIACVLVLLYRVSHGTCNFLGTIREEPIPHYNMELLAGHDCLNALLDYVERCNRPLGRAARILSKVMSNALCLMSILKNRFALRLHNMSINSKHPSTKCEQCKQTVRLCSKLLSQLTILAESSYGIGEISYQLLKGSSSIKQTLSLTLPYIVRTEKPLKKFLIECSALSLLFTQILESKEDIQEYVTALAKLATNVHIRDPKTLENRFKDQVCVSYDPILDNLSAEEIVTFELDDASTVRANKVFLCQNSEVFSAMLLGCFKESIQKFVRLKNVSKPALEYLFTLLHLGLNNTNCDIKDFPMANKLETNLEALLLADRFLFEKLKNTLSSAILQFQMTPETADKIYMWSLNDGMGFLCVESVAYLLTGKMCEKDRTRSFKALFNLDYKGQWLDDIKSLICRQLVK